MNDSSTMAMLYAEVTPKYAWTMGKEGPSHEECLEMGRTCACSNLRRASRAVSQVFDAHFDAIGLKATQFTLLSVLLYESEGGPTVSHLAELLVLEQSSLSRNLAVLERQGLVRLVAGADKRERIILLTRAGRSAVARGYPVWKRAQSAIAAAMDPTELQTQLRSLRRLTKTAQSLLPIGSRVKRENRAKRPAKTAARAP